MITTQTFAVDPRSLETRNMAKVGNLVLASAKKRRESRGLHYNQDWPSTMPLAPGYCIATAKNPVKV